MDKREKKMLKIIETSKKILDLGDLSMDYAMLTDTMRELCDAKYAAFNLFDPQGNCFQTKGLSGLPNDVDKAMETLGFHIQGKTWHLDDRKHGRLVDQPVVIYQHLRELTEHVLPDILIHRIESLFNIGNVVVVGIVQGGKVLGDFTIFLAKGATLEDQEILVLYASQVGLLLKKRQEEIALQENQQKMDLVLEASNAGTWVWNIQTNQAEVGLRWAAMLGQTLEELGTMNMQRWEEFLHPEDRDRAVTALYNAIQGVTDDFFVEYRMRHKDGEWVWILVQGKILEWTEDGQPFRMFGTHTDISDTKKIIHSLRTQEENYRMLVENSYDIIYRLDLEGNFTFISNAWSTLLGQSVEEALGRSFRPFVHPEDLSGVECFFQQIKDTKQRQEWSHYRLLHENGSWRWYTTTATPIWDNEGRLIGYTGTARDVTEVKAAYDELAEKNQAMEYFFAINPDLILITDLRGIILQLNQAWDEVLGYEPNSLVGRSFMELVHPEDTALTINAVSALEKGEAIWNFVNRYQRADGSYRYLEWNSQSSKGLIFAAARDITERLERQQEVEYLSFHDHLTGLYNRRYLDDSLKRLDTPRNLPFSIILLDVDNLKVVNDRYGHFAGDDLLIEVAEALTRTCRSDDILCRMGGDEFIILLPGTAEWEVRSIIQRIMEELVDVRVKGQPVSMAAGYGIKTREDESISEVLERADKRMYQKKIQGRA